MSNKYYIVVYKNASGCNNMENVERNILYDKKHVGFLDSLGGKGLLGPLLNSFGIEQRLWGTCLGTALQSSSGSQAALGGNRAVLRPASTLACKKHGEIAAHPHL